MTRGLPNPDKYGRYCHPLVFVVSPISQPQSAFAPIALINLP